MSQFHSTVLSNGLTLLVETLPQAYSISAGFFVKTGSRDESPVESGASHFLEHLVFKGSEKRSSDDVNKEFDKMGASYNACTGVESTIFYSSFLPEFLEPILELWSDILRPAIRQSDFDSERQVILEELKMYQDEPPYEIDELARHSFFNGHPLGAPVIGTLESLNAMTTDVIRDYFNRQYAPNNIVLCVTGKVDFELAVRLAEKYFSAWKPQNITRTLQPFVPGKLLKEIIIPTAAEEYIIDWIPGPNPVGKDYYTALLMAALIGDDVGSRFYWDLSDVGITNSALYSYVIYTEVGAFNASFSCNPENEIECLEAISNVYKNILKNGFTKEEFELTLRCIQSAMIMRDEDVISRMHTVANDWIYEKKYLTVDDEIEVLKSVALDDINEMAQRYLSEYSVRYIIKPE